MSEDDAPEVYDLPDPDAAEGYDPPGSTEEDDAGEDGRDGCLCDGEG